MSVTEDTTIRESWVSPPSDTILRLIHEKGLNLKLFKTKTNLSSDDFLDFICDDKQVDESLLELLVDEFGGSTEFWLNRYNNYRAQLDVINNIFYEKNKDIIERIKRVRNFEDNSLLKSLRLATYEQLIVEYFLSPSVLYSKSQKIIADPARLATWIRDCEMIGEKILIENSFSTFTATALEDNLHKVLKLGKINDSNKLIKELKAVLPEFGIVLVASPSYQRLGVSGLTKTILRNYKLVVVTDRFKNNAHLWFTLIHELAHCILHNKNNAIVHYSGDNFEFDSLDENGFQEVQANNYVEQLLFDVNFQKELEKTHGSYKQIIRLAIKYELPSALVAAQAHRKKYAPMNFFRKIFKSVHFNKIY